MSWGWRTKADRERSGWRDAVSWQDPASWEDRGWQDWTKTDWTDWKVDGGQDCKVADAVADADAQLRTGDGTGYGSSGKCFSRLGDYVKKLPHDTFTKWHETTTTWCKLTEEGGKHRAEIQMPPASTIRTAIRVMRLLRNGSRRYRHPTRP